MDPSEVTCMKLLTQFEFRVLPLLLIPFIQHEILLQTNGVLQAHKLLTSLQALIFVLLP